MRSSTLAKGRALLPSLALLALAFLLAPAALGESALPTVAFPTQTTYDRNFTAYGAGPFVLADITGDGWTDMAAIDDVRQAVWIYDGSAQGLPQVPTFGIGIPGVLGLAAGDLDGNGCLDLLAMDGTRVLEFVRSGGNWTLRLAFTATSARAVAAGDFDHDGRTDLAVLGSAGASVWFQQSGLPRFTANASVGLASGVSFQSLVTGDLDGDGRDDLALAKPYEVHVFFQGSQGLALQSIDFSTKSSGGSVSLAILPALDVPYLVDTNAGQEGYVGLWRWDGSQFENEASFAGPFTAEVAIGDANDDHQADLAVVRLDGSVNVFLQRGGVLVSSAADMVLRGAAGTANERVALGDVNADGFGDVIVRAHLPDAYYVYLQEDAPPALIRAIPSTYVVNRGTFAKDIVDLRQFFTDDHNRLAFSVTFESDPARLHATVDRAALDFEAKGTWYGSAQFRVDARDGNPSHPPIESNLFSVLVNDPPQVTSTPVLRATVGERYAYVMTVQDDYPAGDGHTFALVEAPDGMTIDAATGLVSWTPTASQQGAWEVALEVQDGNGGATVQRFTVVVAGIGAASPLLLLAVGLAASSAALLAAAALINENARYLFLLFFLPMYTKIKRERVLDHFVRGQIFGYIQANPGEHYNAIKDALGLTNGSLAHHLRTLEREQFVKSKRYGLYRRFYPMNYRMPADDVYQPNEVQQTILATIRDRPGITQKEIAGRLGLTPPTVNYHINVLSDRNLIRVERMGRSTHCTIVEGTQT